MSASQRSAEESNCIMSCIHIQQELQVGVQHSRLYNRERGEDKRKRGGGEEREEEDEG